MMTAAPGLCLANPRGPRRRLRAHLLRGIEAKANTLEQRILEGKVSHEALTTVSALVTQARTSIGMGRDDIALVYLQDAEAILSA
jgi:hypothetical protein